MVKVRFGVINLNLLVVEHKPQVGLQGHVGPATLEHLESVEMVLGIHMAVAVAVAGTTVEAALLSTLVVVVPHSLTPHWQQK
jgi:hypothetical protein